MSDFFKVQFDKLLLAGLLIMFCGMAFYAFHHGGDSGLAAFATDQAKVFGGALLGLITGHVLAQAKPGPPPANSGPSPASGGQA